MNRKPRLDHIRAFGSDAYAHIPKQLRKKWDKKSQKLILVGYHADSCNYRLFDPHTDKIIISRDVAIHETSDYLQRNSEDESQIIIETASITQDRNENKSHSDEDDDFKQDVPAHQNNSRILRNSKSIKPPNRYQANLVEYDEPSSYEEAITTEDADDWKRAINEELQAHELNGTWTFENLPEGNKTIASKWVFKKKYVTHTNTHKYKARLCAKGFT